MDRRDSLLHCAGGAAAAALGAHPAPEAVAAPGPRGDRMAWWREARFGMFIHFGLYSGPGGEWHGTPTGSHEWMRHNARIPDDEYRRLADAFAPAALDADAWVRAARDAGQRYVVLTTKHHEGFALFHSDVSRYTTAHTPLRRDVCAEVARACRAHGLELGWYYSIMDWHHPDYLPRREWESRDATGADFARYVAFMKAQLHELLTRYGDVAVLWFDGQWESTWTHAAALELEAYCRRLMPGVIINDRIDVAPPEAPPPGYRRAGDYVTPELTVPERGLPGQDWETCMTMNRNWGYAKDDPDFKSVPTLVKLLVETASKGGNLLLNVGPDGDGRIPPPSLEGLAGMGAWLRTNGRAIHGTVASPFAAPLPRAAGAAPVRVTRRERALHLFLETWEGGPVVLPGVREAPRSVRVLGAEGTPVAWARTPDGIALTMPERGPDLLVPVVEVAFASPVRVGS
ncbi:MAG: alpha-L-fucosidase [Gemmatimonadota bacterium]